MSFTAELPHLSFLHASLHCATEIRPSGPVFAQLARKRQQESERDRQPNERNTYCGSIWSLAGFILIVLAQIYNGQIVNFDSYHIPPSPRTLYAADS